MSFASIKATLKRAKEIRVEQDKETAKMYKDAFGTKNKATAAYGATIAAGIGLNVAVGKLLNHNGYVKAAKVVYGLTVAGVAIDTPRYKRTVDFIRK